MLSRIKTALSKDISKFLFANILYSLSTWLIGFIVPYILPTETYQGFIYLFQNVLYLTSVFMLGLTPALLRYYKYAPETYSACFNILVTVVFSILLLLGLWLNNPVSSFLSIDIQDRIQHLLFYISVICSLLYVFNRALLTAKEDYNKLTKTIVLIFVLRILALFIIYYFRIEQISIILLLICIVPMTYEWFIYIMSCGNFRRLDSHSLKKFICFALTTSCIGILFTTANRLYLLETKKFSDQLAAIISYSYGMIGIMNIFSTTFTTYFIGKLDSRNQESINNYIKRLKVYLPSFAILTILICVFAFYFVKVCYPYDKVVAGIYTATSLLFTASFSYIGLFSLLTKTYNLLNKQLIVNICSLIVVAIAIHYIDDFSNIYNYILVNMIQVWFELVVCFIVLRHIKTEL